MRNALVALSEKTRWSVMAKVGSSSAMRLTVLIPLIGVFLLFNQATEAFLAWPSFFREDLRITVTSNLPTQNLYFTYFGLCLLGVGSVLFAAFCPSDIRDQPNLSRYVIDTPAVNSPVIAKDDFRTVLALRFDNEPSETEGGNERLDYPHALEGDLHVLMEELYDAVEFEDGDTDDMPEVMLGTGYLDFTNLARRLRFNIRAEWAFTLPFYAVAPRFGRDIAFVKFKSLDYTNFHIRVAVSLIYLVGFALLLKPTLHVFWLLATAWAR